MKDEQKPDKKRSGSNGMGKKASYSGFTKEEIEAMRERTREMKAESTRNARSNKVDNEKEVLSRIAEMPDHDRTIAERIHELIRISAPSLSPRTWYGMPAYSIDNRIICFFQSSHKFKSRYSTLGFSDKALLDDGDMWPTSFAIKDLSTAVEEKIKTLLEKAVKL